MKTKVPPGLRTRCTSLKKLAWFCNAAMPFRQTTVSTLLPACSHCERGTYPLRALHRLRRRSKLQQTADWASWACGRTGAHLLGDGSFDLCSLHFHWESRLDSCLPEKACRQRMLL